MTDYMTATGVVRRALERHSYQLIGGLISDYSRDQFFAVIRRVSYPATEVRLITINGELFTHLGDWIGNQLNELARKAFAPALDNKIDTALRVGNAENRADAAEHKVHTLEMKLENANQTIDQAQWELTNLRGFKTIAEQQADAQYETNQELRKKISDLQKQLVDLHKGQADAQYERGRLTDRIVELAESNRQLSATAADLRKENDNLKSDGRRARAQKMVDVGLISPADAELILGLTTNEIKEREHYVQRRLSERFQPAVVGPVQYTPRGDRFWRLTRSGRRDARFSLTEHELTFRTIGSWEIFIAERIERLFKQLAATEPTHQPRVPVDLVVGPLTSIVRGMDDVSPKTLRNQLEDVIEDIDRRAE